MKAPNRLINSTSPYLLQHAYNPIDWHPWGPEALALTKQADKPILISIGYAACHWCHVMAHESFEDLSVAAIMNHHFINIKVDRQENPDIDQVAIAAMQAMGLNIGWPLHLFLLPNQQPFYGGNYFPPQAWKQLLQSIANAFRQHRGELVTAAFHFTKTLYEKDNTVFSNKSCQSSQHDLDAHLLFEKVYQGLDHHYGGLVGEPKFLIPSSCFFLLHYYQHYADHRALAQLDCTLIHLACGGIYDQLRGGFFRYSIDKAWHIPHFEKMLYDNAQMISLYAHAYLATKKPLYKTILLQSMTLLEHSMYHADGAFYAALDADSQGREGAFYTWTYSEIAAVLGKDTHFFTHYFNISAAGNWKDGQNVLYKKVENWPAYNHPVDEQRLIRLQQLLCEASTHRTPPALEDQVITSWNGMMLQALVDAYHALGDAHWLDLARNNATYIENYLMDGAQLWHSYSQNKKQQLGYLEDYAWVSRGFISLYQATLETHWLHQAEQLVQYALQYFEDRASNLYHFTQHGQPVLLKKTQEIVDQVIPSSNAVLANNLLDLAYLLNKPSYQELSDGMLAAIAPSLAQEPGYMTYWASLYIKKTNGVIVITLTGPDQLHWARVLKKAFPNLLVNHCLKDENLIQSIPKPLAGKTAAYVCHQSCYGPFDSLEAVLDRLYKGLILFCTLCCV